MYAFMGCYTGCTSGVTLTHEDCPSLKFDLSLVIFFHKIQNNVAHCFYCLTLQIGLTLSFFLQTTGMKGRNVFSILQTFFVTHKHTQ